MVKRAIILAICLPVDALGLIVVALVTLGSRPTWIRVPGALVVTPRSSSWLARCWPYSTTFGHVVLLHPLHGTRVLEHELVHVRQAEAACCTWALAALVSWDSLAVLYAWPFAWLLVYLSSCLAAWLAGRDWYTGSVFEQHAREESGA